MSLQIHRSYFLYNSPGTRSLVPTRAPNTKQLGVGTITQIPKRLSSHGNVATMSSGYSNTDTGNKPADPYTRANKDTEATTQEKFDALDKFVNARKFGMMTTCDKKHAGKLVSRCMAVAAKETESMDYLFFTNTESHKTDELKSDPHVNISFLDGSGQWASVSGTASIETNRELVKKYYNPTLKAWMGDLGDGTHDGSENDPRIGIIRVKMETATYAITDLNILGRMAEVAKGMVTGEQANVNKIREITEEEVRSRRSSCR